MDATAKAQTAKDSQVSSSSSSEPESSWSKYLNLVGFIGLLVAIIYINPLAGVPPPLTKLGKQISSLLTPATPKLPARGQVAWEDTASWENLADLYRANGCPEHRFKAVRRVSRDPEIILIENFLTPAEAQFLVHAAYVPSFYHPWIRF
jgi:hypothetical protein